MHAQAAIARTALRMHARTADGWHTLRTRLALTAAPRTHTHVARAGANPFEGYTPLVPEGEALDYGSQRFMELEAGGLAAVGRAAFVLVAGGLGERLGYPGEWLAAGVVMCACSCMQTVVQDCARVRRPAALHCALVKTPCSPMLQASRCRCRASLPAAPASWSCTFAPSWHCRRRLARPQRAARCRWPS